jgi:C4-type Zn-finger protein
MKSKAMKITIEGRLERIEAFCEAASKRFADEDEHNERVRKAVDKLTASTEALEA